MNTLTAASVDPMPSCSEAPEHMHNYVRIGIYTNTNISLPLIGLTCTELYVTQPIAQVDT